MSPPTSAERSVLRVFLIGLLVMAAAVIAGTWVQKSRACSATCAAQGQPGSFGLSGGGRFGMSTVCRCGEAPRASAPST